ncbi:maltokinase N-terminal cap-like domain-containing protein [Streptomyces hypolithicus]
MAVVHRTTLTPSKLELLAPWLPEQPWYAGKGGTPHLARAGGFRLDDPQGEVGMEFMVVTDGSGAASGAGPVEQQPTAYFIPLSYRGAPLDGAGHALIGTMEHGVLGRRWVYDGTHDPVLVAQLFALIAGTAVPQDQSESNTPDPSVTSAFTGTGLSATTAPTSLTDGPYGTELVVPTASASGPHTEPASQLTVRVNRVLDPDALAAQARTTATQDLGHVTAGWLLPNGTTVRAPFVAVHRTSPDQP